MNGVGTINTSYIYGEQIITFSTAVLVQLYLFIYLLLVLTLRKLARLSLGQRSVDR